MFNQERHVGLRVSSWSFQFFCVPSVTGGYGVQTTGFILHLAYLKLYIFGNQSNVATEWTEVMQPHNPMQAVFLC